MSSQEGFHASQLQLLGQEKEGKMSDGSGMRCLELYKLHVQNGLSEKMYLGLSRLMKGWHSRMCVLTWKEKVTPYKRLLFQLVPKTRTTEETGFGLLPTPTSSDGTSGGVIGKNDTYYQTSGLPRKITQNGVDGSVGLGRLVQMWPTPNAGDDRDRGNLSNPCIQRRKEIGKQIMLSQCVSEESGRLNPDWVEPLMGYPVGWTDLEKDNVTHEITEFVGNPDDSGEPRVTTRSDLRAKRLKQLGNSIVPQVASEIFKAIRSIEDE